jgi:hypothetical protein
MTNAFIMYRKRVLERIDIRSSGGFEMTMEIIGKAYLLGYKITEVPTINRERAAGKSKFKLLAWISKYLFWYLYTLIHSNKKRMMQMIGGLKENRVR